MKRVGYLWDRTVSVENCRLAIENALRKKKWKRGAMRMLNDLDSWAKWLSENPFPDNRYRERTVTDHASGKVRNLLVPSTLDLCRQHMAMQVLNPILERSFHAHSFACRKGMGFIRCAMYVRRKLRSLRRKRLYFAKLDVVRFYDSVDKGIMKSLLRRKVKDARFLALMDAIIDGTPRERGLPIGNYTSQILANFYLSFADFRADSLGHAVYARYADDMLICHGNKRKLARILRSVASFLSSRLNLRVHSERTSVRELTDSGDGFIDFCGFKAYRHHSGIRKRTFARIRKAASSMRRFPRLRTARSFSSYWGYLRRADCFGWTKANADGLIGLCSGIVSRHDRKCYSM